MLTAASWCIAELCAMAVEMYNCHHFACGLMDSAFAAVVASGYMCVY